MRVLVTGGAGFVGSHVADALIAAGHGVRVLDNLHPAAHAGEPGGLHPAAEQLRGDVRDGEVVRAALDGVDAVSHQAAMVGLGADLGDLPDYVAHNDLGTAVLLAELARAPRPLVLASSMVVYGEGAYACAEHGPVRPAPRRPAALAAGAFEAPCPVCGAPLDPRPVGEDALPDPRSVYAATKLQQELLATVWGRETATPVCALRYHNVYGPRMPCDTPYAGVASLFRSALEAGRAPAVFEDGRQLRDFVHVRDVARANVLALESAAHGSFNVCSGTPRSVGELADALADATGPVAPRPLRTGRFRLGDVRHVFADPGRARCELGFGPEEDWTAGIAEFAQAELRAAVTRS